MHARRDMMSQPGLSHVVWRKSTLSGTNNNCVEVAILDGGAVAVRNSKRPQAGVTLFTPDEWKAFVGGVKQGEFDLA
ncbi:DUF397 domain-containing protein [Sphaerisporangium sp. NPDC088356]|uniref:DUF397 domain-containing protein n=1 Tax=Sphaerisporangium sp. NPDC088356 TaxID=3154871 RepID=UPI00344554C9